MLWSEFIQGTKCKDTEYNYKVYKQLESLYMINDNLTKEDIYKTGKMLVDNAETPEEKKLRQQIETSIEEYTVWINENNKAIETIKELIARDTEYINAGVGGDTEKYNIKYWKKEIKRYRGEISMWRNKINLLRSI